jgi:hypothetical protein
MQQYLKCFFRWHTWAAGRADFKFVMLIIAGNIYPAVATHSESDSGGTNILHVPVTVWA